MSDILWTDNSCVGRTTGQTTVMSDIPLADSSQIRLCSSNDGTHKL